MWLSQLSELPSCRLGCICSGLFCHWCHFTIRCSGMAWPVLVVADGSSPGAISDISVDLSKHDRLTMIDPWPAAKPGSCLMDFMHSGGAGFRWNMPLCLKSQGLSAICEHSSRYCIMHSEMECIWFMLIVVACSCDILSLTASQVSKILDVLVTEGNTFDVKSDTSVDEIIQYFNKRGVYYEAACRMVFICVYICIWYDIWCVFIAALSISVSVFLS